MTALNWVVTIFSASHRLGVGALALSAVLINVAFLSVHAAPLHWGSFTNIVNNANLLPSGNGTSAVYYANSVRIGGYYRGGSLPANVKWSLVYQVDMGDGLRTAGGLDGIGATGVGWINARRDAVPKITGLYDDQTANYPVDSVHYCIFVDLNGDGDYGTYDKATRQFAPDPDEFAVVNQVAGFSPFHAGGEPLSAGEIVAYYADPIAEPTALTLSGINCGPGVSDSANVVALSVVSEPANSWFFVHYCTNLLASEWTDINPNGYFPVENTTTVYHTNVMPTVFYRVSSAPAH